MTDGPEKESQRDVWVRQVRARRERREKAEREGDNNFWQVVGMMGSVGWTVALPTAAGALLGRWIDSKVEGDGQVFMFFLLLVGLTVGCIIAWRTVSEKL